MNFAHSKGIVDERFNRVEPFKYRVAVAQGAQDEFAQESAAHWGNGFIENGEQCGGLIAAVHGFDEFEVAL